MGGVLACKAGMGDCLSPSCPVPRRACRPAPRPAARLSAAWRSRGPAPRLWQSARWPCGCVAGRAGMRRPRPVWRCPARQQVMRGSPCVAHAAQGADARWRAGAAGHDRFSGRASGCLVTPGAMPQAGGTQNAATSGALSQRSSCQTALKPPTSSRFVTNRAAGTAPAG